MLYLQAYLCLEVCTAVEELQARRNVEQDPAVSFRNALLAHVVVISLFRSLWEVKDDGACTPCRILAVRPHLDVDH